MNDIHYVPYHQLVPDKHIPLYTQNGFGFAVGLDSI